jgi:hypothetical protein
MTKSDFFSSLLNREFRPSDATIVQQAPSLFTRKAVPPGEDLSAFLDPPTALY